MEFCNYSLGSLRICVDGHERAEPPIIVTPTSSTASPIPPKYLELIHDDQDDHLLDHHHQTINTISNGYEIPLADEDELNDHFRETNCPCCIDSSSVSSSSNTISLESRHPSNYQPSLSNPIFDHQSISPTRPVCEKERTFSSSSTVSELSNDQPLCATTVLKVALPNTKEDCSSDETLLEHHNRRDVPEIMTVDTIRIPTLYPHVKDHRDTEILACGESKTMM